MPKIRTAIKRAVLKVTGAKVLSLEEIRHGEISFVYRLSTDRGSLLIRIFRFEDWPNLKKLRKVQEVLLKNKIPTARIIFQDRSSKFFPYGFDLAEFIEGCNGAEAIRSGQVGFAEFHRKLGTLLRKVHSVKFVAYGSLASEKRYKNYFFWMLARLKKHLKKIKSVKGVPENVESRIRQKVLELVEGLDRRFMPVLVHGDPTPDNCVWMPKRQIVLVDWDNAKIGLWAVDYAWLTYWGSHLTEFGTREKRRLVINRAFFKGYGKAPFNQAELSRVERALHLLMAGELLGYYYYAQKDRNSYNRTLLRLKQLLAGD